VIESIAAGDGDLDFFITGTLYKSIKFWDLKTRKCLDTIERAHKFSINHLAISPDKTFFLSGAGDLRGDDDCIKMWDL